MEYIYAAMLIHKLGKKVTEETVKKVIESAGGKADDGKIKALIAALEGVDIERVIKEASVPVAAPAATEAKKEDKSEEKKAEEEKVSEDKAAAGLSSLFG